uniref:long-chain-fatty-acid--CoA ligase n=1 Tax=Lepeophtheirus salmonis TaxID=72036 RepID=A0A0K2V5Z2_LEPSM
MSNDKIISYSTEKIEDAKEYTTTLPDGSVIIRRKKDDLQPMSVPSFVKHNCLKGGSQIAMAIKRNGDWMRWTYSQYYREIRLAAKAFIKLGLKPFHTVSIYSFNCPEWMISNLGAIFAGGFATGLYPSNSASMNEYLMNNSRCQILVVENNHVLQKVQPILENIKHLLKVVVIEEDGFIADKLSILWRDLIELGKTEEEDQLKQRLHNIAANQCCSIIYTSGTTGNPKGVMISHDMLTYTAKTVVEKHGWTKKISIVSYLPLSHIAANALDIYVVICCRGELYFADKSALKGSLVRTLKEVRPTVFFGVPRVYEKFQEGIEEKISKLKKSQKFITNILKDAAFCYNTTGNKKFIKNLGNQMLYKKIKDSLGLDQCQEFSCGGAPLMPTTTDFFLSLDIVIKVAYGLSECGIFSDFAPSEYKKGTCGSIFPSTQGKFIKKLDENMDGELCIKGRCVMMGYLYNKDATKESFDEDGYFHTGDLGFVDKDGFYSITGRKKELLITAGGENIAPILIEDNIKNFLPVLSNVVAIGDLKKFISVFLTFKVNSDTNGQPSTELSNSVKEWCHSLGYEASTVTNIIRDQPPEVMSAIQKGIDMANEIAVSNAARVKKWSLIPRELSMDNGEMGPTLKLKRNEFSKIHCKQINNLYA